MSIELPKDLRTLTRDDIMDISKACYKSSKVAAKVLFPDRFYREFDKEHDKIFDLLDNSDNPRKIIAAPRGTGKTSLSNLLIPAKRLVFLDSKFIVPVSSTQAAAEQQSENLKAEFLSNIILRTIFDVQKTKSFSKKQWVAQIAGVEAMVWPKGAGQQVRGMLFHNSRPSLIVVDDLENDEAIQSEVQRKKLKEWFFGPLINIVDRGRRDWEMIYIDTLKHEDSLLQNLLEDPNWDSVTLELFDDAYQTKFPNMISNDGVTELVKLYRDQGQLDVLYREYRNLPISSEDKSFQASYFRYYNNYDNKADYVGPNFSDSNLFETVIVIDPAKTTKLKSAESAIVGGSINLKTGEIYFRDIMSGKWHPEEMYAELIGMIKRLRPTVVGVEVTGLNEFITYPLQNVLIKNAPLVQLVELHARGGVGEPGKVTRIKSLVGFYRQGLVWHNQANSGGLEGQLLSFPRSRRWDIMDAAGYFVELFEKGRKYAGSTQDDLPTKQEVDDEWKQLGYTQDEIEGSIVMGGV